MSGPPFAVDATDLWFHYGTTAVLEGVNARIRDGAVTAILGPNGVGKTTLLNIVLGWLSPDRGSLRFFGRPAETLSRGERGQTLSLLPQDEHIPFEFTIAEYVLLGRTPYLPPLSAPGYRDREIVSDALARVGLAGCESTAVTEISGGERQLVLLARCLAQQPRILLLDEPTSHLDLGNKRRLADLIASLAAEGATVLFTTHDPEFAAVCADDVLLLHRGQTLAHGPAEETLTDQLLSRTFGLPVRRADTGGRITVIW